MTFVDPKAVVASVYPPEPQIIQGSQREVDVETWPQMPAAVAKAVNGVMSEIRPLAKTGKNNFHGYKYATIGELMAALQPALVTHGLIVMQTEMDVRVMDGALAVRYRFGLAHISGAVWSCPIIHTGMATLKNTKGGIDDKAFNKTHTAARKYFLLGLFQIPVLDEGDERLSDGDPDHEEDRGREEEKPKVQVTEKTATQPSIRERYKSFKTALDGAADSDEAAKVWKRGAALLRELPQQTLEDLEKDFAHNWGSAPPKIEKEAA